MGSLLMVIALSLMSIIVLGVATWWGARVVKSPRATVRRCMLASFAIVGICLLTYALLGDPAVHSADSIAMELIQAFLPLGVMIFVGAALFRTLFKVTFPRSVIILLFLIGANLLTVPTAFLVIRPYLVQSFKMSSLSMAPTVAGPHGIDRCEKCGGIVFTRIPEDPNDPDRNSMRREGVCTQCGSIDHYIARVGSPQSADRIMVNKVVEPRRWDIVAYRPPRFRGPWIARLVGMPGETVFVDDGSVWVNGQRLAPPAVLGQLRYSTVSRGPQPFATRADPLVLGPGQYFLLGDSSERAMDCRYHGAIPRSSLVGVADWCYWPLSRLRFLRL